MLARLEESHDLQDTSWLKLKYIFRDSPVIKAGRYNIHRGTDLSSLIDRFVIGDVEKFKFTIIEGTVAKNNLNKLEKILADNDLLFEIPQKDPFQFLQYLLSHLDHFYNHIIPLR